MDYSGTWSTMLSRIMKLSMKGSLNTLLCLSILLLWTDLPTSTGLASSPRVEIISRQISTFSHRDLFVFSVAFHTSTLPHGIAHEMSQLDYWVNGERTITHAILGSGVFLRWVQFNLALICCVSM